MPTPCSFSSVSGDDRKESVGFWLSFSQLRFRKKAQLRTDSSPKPGWLVSSVWEQACIPEKFIQKQPPDQLCNIYNVANCAIQLSFLLW